MSTEPTCGDCVHIGRPFASGDGYFAACDVRRVAVGSKWVVALAMPDRTACPQFAPRPITRLRSLRSEAERHVDELANGTPQPETLDAVGPFLRIAEFCRQEEAKLEGELVIGLVKGGW